MISSKEPGVTRPAVIPLLVMAAAAVAMAALELHRGPVYSALWLFGVFAEGAAYLVLLAVCLPMMVVLGLGRRPIPIVIGLVLMVLGLASGPVSWADPALRAQIRFFVERPAFGRVVELSRQGRLPVTGQDAYYGPELPGLLCYLSANCRVATLGYSGGQPILYIPDWIGIPDDSIGFAHFAGEASGRYDGFGMQICPVVPLGEGWWWMDSCASAAPS
ncbi:hypothetical protein AAH991_15560 [Microbispora sp. ZYX-F-249]|uniref:DUF4190 domain-containing protein n=1 Tax=Microbispora maris TaxID=3144104 RepID=A0ABV0AQH8_9ACTN